MSIYSKSWKEIIGWNPMDILDEFGFNNISRPTIVIDMKSFLIRMGIDNIFFVDNSGWDAALSFADDTLCIWINNALNDSQKRWMLAVELGHIVLHSHDKLYRDRYTVFETRLDALQAMQFAAELLMPRYKITVLMTVCTDSYPKELSKMFGVEEKIMQQRLSSYRFGKKFGEL